LTLKSPCSYALFQGVGGSGGGVLHWINGEDFFIDGLIDVSATSGTGGNAGGGSGGSVWIKTLNFTG